MIFSEHGSHFQSGCNQCVCHSGEKICTTRECLPAHPSTRQRNEFTGKTRKYTFRICFSSPFLPYCSIRVNIAYTSMLIVYVRNLEFRHFLCHIG